MRRATRHEARYPLWGEDWDAVRAQWLLDPSVTFLNHGSFGACPRPVLARQADLREQMERQPVSFLWRQLPGLLAEARERAAAFLGADPGGFAWVKNATTGVATVLAAIDLGAGDEVVLTDHAYPAVLNAVRRACQAKGAAVVVAPIPVPLQPPAEIVAGLMDQVTDRTRLVVVEQVTSPTGVLLPVAAIVASCRAQGVPVLVDGAHAPGQIPVDLEAMGADLWTGNFHKWTCAPKGSAALIVSRQHRAWLHPLVASHGMGEGLHREFDWIGTDDPTAYLSVPAALEFLEALGLARVQRYDHDLAAYGQSVVAEALGTDPPVPDDRFASMALVALPDGMATTKDDADRLQSKLYERTRIEVPFVSWNGRGYLRLSGQVYNTPQDYDRLGSALPPLVAGR
jgi:isopenicillin-N epimerase